MKKIALPLIIFSLIISGCTTHPPKEESIKLVAKERLYDQGLYEATEVRSIPVTITRDGGSQGALAIVFLKIDGNYVTWFNSREETTIYLDNAGYVFELVVASCPELQRCSNSLDINIKDGVNNNFRIVGESDFPFVSFSLVRTKT